MYLVLDLETEDETKFKRKGNPWFNKVLTIGFKHELFKAESFIWTDDIFNESSIISVDTLVGHNIKYDLLYLWNNDEIQEFLLNSGQIWDTQLAEYILSGQRHIYPALRDIAVNKYNCKEREKLIQTAYGKGLSTKDMDINELLYDVKNDVLDTESVYLQQVELAKKKGMYELIQSQMTALLGTIEIEYNGIFISIEKLSQDRNLLLTELNKSNKELKILIEKYWNKEIPKFNPRSTKHLSALFFGGEFKVKEKQPILNALGDPLITKTGKNRGRPRLKNVECFKQILGLGLNPTTETKRKGVFETGEKILSIIAQKKSTDTGKIAKLMIDIRGLEKLIGTYYDAIEDLIYPDNCLHSQFSHCGYEKRGEDSLGGGTQTGRLSCVNPNIQNVPRSGTANVKDYFVSRFEYGKIIEFDYHMLEVVVFAFLTQDKQLIEDISLGVDIHRTLTSLALGKALEDVTTEERQKFKPGTFLIIYGGSYKKLSRDHNLPEDIAKRFVKQFYERYPQTKIWQLLQVQKVKQTSRYIDEYTKKGFKVREGYLKSITGREYWFKTNDTPDFISDDTGFNPPDIKNYPVQGLATADIVLACLGKLFYYLQQHKDKCLLVNTVHDSVIIDCKKEYVDWACENVKNVLESVNEIMKEQFNLDFNIPIKVDYKIGDCWGNCK